MSELNPSVVSLERLFAVLAWGMIAVTAYGVVELPLVFAEIYDAMGREYAVYRGLSCRWMLDHPAWMATVGGVCCGALIVWGLRQPRRRVGVCLCGVLLVFVLMWAMHMGVTFRL